MKLSSIQARLGLLFLAFVLLITISAGATFWGIEAQKKDALIINLAGRQRMLVQQMSRLALEIELGGNERFKTDLQEAESNFERTLDALQYGGEAPYLPEQDVIIPGAQTAEIQEQLNRIRSTWQNFQGAIDGLLSASPGSAESVTQLETVEQLSPTLVQQADTAVRMFEADANRKISWLRGIQIGFLSGALLLLAAGVWITKRSVLVPLQQLDSDVERIREGDLTTVIQVHGPDEVQVVARTFENMREQLMESQQELVSWADLLEKRVEKRTLELEALNGISREISSRLDVQHVLHSVTEKARELLGAKVAALCLLDENYEVLELNALSGPFTAVVGERTNELSGLTSQVLAGERALLCGGEYCQGGCGILSEFYRASHLAAPLRVGDHVIGALCVGSPERNVFTGEASDLLTKLANSAAIALENARLYAKAERLATLEERQRIAAEIHDGLGQTLSYLGLTVDQVSEFLEEGRDIQAMAQLQRVRSVIGKAIHEAREAITNLQEETPLHTSLQDQLEAVVQEFAKQGEERVEWSSSIEKPLVLDKEEMEHVLRVTREALLNARNHGQGTQIIVKLDQIQNDLVLTVGDDGRGFDPNVPPADGRKHFGLHIMQARATHLGGRLDIHSVREQGTQVKLIWPGENRAVAQKGENEIDTRIIG